MSEENRYSRTVRDWTKLIAELMRTPDDQLETFADHSSAADNAGAARLRQVRDLLDALGEGMQTDTGNAFWQKMEVAWKVLCTAQGLGAAPLPQPAAAPQLNETAHMPVLPDPAPRIDNSDFRSNVMYGTPGEDSSVERAGSSEGPWKPHADGLAQPFPGQNETLAVDALNLSDAALQEAQATMAAMDWPLSRVAQLGAAVSAHQQRGEPSRTEICRWFGLPTDASIDLVLKGWAERMAADAVMTQSYNTLLAQLRQGAPPYRTR